MFFRYKKTNIYLIQHGIHIRWIYWWISPTRGIICLYLLIFRTDLISGRINPLTMQRLIYNSLSLASIFGNILYTETGVTFVLCRIYIKWWIHGRSTMVNYYVILCRNIINSRINNWSTRVFIIRELILWWKAQLFSTLLILLLFINL